jgi:hypothetical protein
MGKLAVVSNSLQMQHLLPRLWIALAISTLAIEHSHPAISKSKHKLTIGHIAERVTATNVRPKQSIREMLASSTSKPNVIAKKSIRPASKGVYPGRVGTRESRSLSGISNLTNPDLDRIDRASPVNRLIK